MTSCLRASLVVLFFSSFPAHAVTIDSFTQIGDPIHFPYTETSIGAPTLLDEVGLTETFGGLRATLVIPGHPVFPPPAGAAPEMSVDVDTASGTMIAAANADSAFYTAVIWTSDDLDATKDFDTTPLNRFVLEYSSSSDLTLEVTLSNLDPGSTNRNAANSGVFVIPAAVNGVVEVPLVDINEGVVNPFGGFPPPDFPPVDLTQLDAIAFIFETLEPGATLTLSNVALVPEPRAAALIAFAALACNVRRSSRVRGIAHRL